MRTDRELPVTFASSIAAFSFAALAALTLGGAGCAKEGAPPAHAEPAVTSGSAKITGRDPVTGPKLPALEVPISHAVRVGDLVYLSGQIGSDPATGKMAEGLAAQTEQIFKNAAAVLEAAGLDLNRVVKCNVYMTNVADFPVMNEIYARTFTKPYPARTTVGVAALPGKAVIEIEMIAR